MTQAAVVAEGSTASILNADSSVDSHVNLIGCMKRDLKCLRAKARYFLFGWVFSQYVAAGRIISFSLYRNSGKKHLLVRRTCMNSSLYANLLTKCG